MCVCVCVCVCVYNAYICYVITASGCCPTSGLGGGDTVGLGMGAGISSHSNDGASFIREEEEEEEAARVTVKC